MNLLIDRLPKGIYVGGREYAIRWDHRTGILYELLMLDEEIEGAEKPLLALRLFYPVMPHNVQEALEGIQWFYRGGKEAEQRKKRGRGGREAIYSFDYDEEYIYSAFLEQYAIDLTEMEGLHWWKFRALFQSIGEDCAFSKIMGYRGMEITKNMSEEQKDFYRRMKERYRIPFSKNEDEKQDAIERALLAGESLAGLL